MKILAIIFGILPFGICLFAQETESKRVQAGLVFGSGLNFQELNTTLFKSGGPGTDITIGMNVNLNFTETIGLCTGTEFDFSNTRFTSNNTIFYRFNDTEILRKGDDSKTYSVFQLKNRTDKAVYLSVPTMFLFRTKHIGYFRYFGKFGLRHSFRLKSESFDDGLYLTGNSMNIQTNDHMSTKGNMFFYKASVGMAAGAEWNFSGSTSIVGELGYYYGITPLYWERSANHEKLSLYTSGFTNGKGVDEYNPLKARQSQLLLKVSILF
jgi:hypothetical protein